MSPSPASARRASSGGDDRGQRQRHRLQTAIDLAGDVRRLTLDLDLRGFHNLGEQLGVAKLLAKVVEEEQPGLVILGKQAISRPPSTSRVTFAVSPSISTFEANVPCAQPSRPAR
jgi:hypothetical protein